VKEGLEFLRRSFFDGAAALVFNLLQFFLLLFESSFRLCIQTFVHFSFYLISLSFCSFLAVYSVFILLLSSSI
jgi:hypothetical protein